MNWLQKLFKEKTLDELLEEEKKTAVKLRIHQMKRQMNN